jgi:nucleoside phosphorylase
MVSPKVDIVILTVIPPEFTSVKAALNIQDNSDNEIKTPNSQTIYFPGEVRSERRNYSLVVGCIGRPGNSKSSSITTEAITEFKPKLLVLVGIAAGIKDTVKLGDVVFSEKIVGYESAALYQLKDGTQIEQPRTEMFDVTHKIDQEIVHYLSRKNQARLNSSFTSIGWYFPTLSDKDRSHLQESNIIQEIEIDRCTIASGEKLIKDPTVLQNIRDNLHGRVKVGEMEATGFAGACNRKNKDWLVIRGVSDFGDTYKSDVFQPLASQTAATVLADFLKHGIDLHPNHQDNDEDEINSISLVAKLKKCNLSQIEDIISNLQVDKTCIRMNGTIIQIILDLIGILETQKEGLYRLHNILKGMEGK